MTHRAEKSRGKSTDPSNTKAKHASDGRKFEQINIKIRINGRSLRYAKHMPLQVATYIQMKNSHGRKDFNNQIG